MTSDSNKIYQKAMELVPAILDSVEKVDSYTKKYLP